MKPVVIFITCLFFFSCKEKKADNDRGKMNLCGNVKTITEKDYFLDTTGNNKGKHLRWTKIYEFNVAGNKTVRRELDEHDELQSKTVYVYNSAGHLREEIDYIEDTVHPSDRTVYTYNKAGLIDSIIFSTSFPDSAIYSKKGINKVGHPMELVISETKHLYNNAHLLIKKHTYFNPVKYPCCLSLFDFETANFEYDKSNNTLKSIAIDRDGFKQATTFSYDDEHNCILETVDTAKEHTAQKIVRKFDEQGNEIEETSYESDGSIHSQKKIEYKSFDKAGNWLVQYIHWKDLGTSIIERSITYYP